MTLYNPHDLVGEMTDIFQVMRLLSLRIHNLPSELSKRILYDRGLYMSEYKLLVVLDSSDDVDDGMATPNRNSHIYGSCRLAAYLYLYIVLRELPISAVIVQTVLKRLKGILESANADLLILWTEDQHLFLWILYMGAVASIEAVEREFFVKVLRRLVGHMGLMTIEGFTAALKEVLWEPGFCERGPTTGCLWAELQQN
jgi:Fungal specific transcription factor domain